MEGYFVDSNILIDITKILTGQINTEDKRYYKHYQDLINLIVYEEVKLLVVPAVLEEIKVNNVDHMVELFIDRLCQKCELTDEELQLADKLYKYYMGVEEIENAVFKDNRNKIKYNYQKARVLAEINILYNMGKYDSVKFITNNLQDYPIKEINNKYNLRNVRFDSTKVNKVKKK